MAEVLLASKLTPFGKNQQLTHCLPFTGHKNHKVQLYKFIIFYWE